MQNREERNRRQARLTSRICPVTLGRSPFRTIARHDQKTSDQPPPTNSKRSFDRTAEDYVEAIAEIEASEVKCRVTDLAAYFAVSHVTVNKTLGRLAKEGWVATTPYGPVTLTESGRKLARDCRNRHEIVLHFLRAIGVTDETSLSDAEGSNIMLAKKHSNACGD